jgi:vacuole morphology and inheritance protein 14
VAALEVEQVVKRLATANDQQRIRQIIDKLIADYAFSPQANYRKVGGGQHSAFSPQAN